MKPIVSRTAPNECWIEKYVTAIPVLKSGAFTDSWSQHRPSHLWDHKVNSLGSLLKISSQNRWADVPGVSYQSRDESFHLFSRSRFRSCRPPNRWGWFGMRVIRWQRAMHSRQVLQNGRCCTCESLRMRRLRLWSVRTSRNQRRHKAAMRILHTHRSYTPTDAVKQPPSRCRWIFTRQTHTRCPRATRNGVMWEQWEHTGCAKKKHSVVMKSLSS